MAMVDWRIQGYDFSNCNCAWGCPCQVNALPTHGHCRAIAAFHIERGRFGPTRLDGLTFLGLFRWPGPIHLGSGEVLPIVDARADASQREALLKIMSGQDTDPGATIFQVMFGTLTKVHDPQFLPIGFELDLNARRGRVWVDGVLDAKVEPIRNPVTGAETRARLVLPDGFEFVEAELASGTLRTMNSPITLSFDATHAHLAKLDMTGRGVVRDGSAYA
jgi:hypothetical protein